MRFKGETGEIVPDIAPEELRKKANGVLRRRNEDVKARRASATTAISSSTSCSVPTAVRPIIGGIPGISRGIKTANGLQKDISAARQTELIANPVAGRFTARHLCEMHRRLLGDVYSFAGRFRREDIAKGENRFLAFQEIGPKPTDLFA